MGEAGEMRGISSCAATTYTCVVYRMPSLVTRLWRTRTSLPPVPLVNCRFCSVTCLRTKCVWLAVWMWRDGGPEDEEFQDVAPFIVTV